MVINLVELPSESSLNDRSMEVVVVQPGDSPRAELSARQAEQIDNTLPPQLSVREAEIIDEKPSLGSEDQNLTATV